MKFSLLKYVIVLFLVFKTVNLKGQVVNGLLAP